MIEAAQTSSGGFGTRSLVSAFTVMALLFGATTVLASWYANERLTRASEYFAAGKRLESAGNTARAIEDYRNALEISPTSDYRLALAQALIRSGRPEGASAYLAELLRSDIGSGEPNLLLARIAEKEGHLDAAVSFYQRAIYGFWPHEAQRNRIEAQWELIRLLERNHMDKQAVAQLLELSEQATNDFPLRIEVARRLLQHRAPAQAAEIYREILRVEPRNAQAQSGLGEAAMALAQYEDAQAAFRRAMRDGDNSEIVRREYEIVNQVLALDPTRHDLSPIERYRRSLSLVQRSAALESSCQARSGVEPAAPPPQQTQGASAVKARDLISAADTNLHLAEQIYGSLRDCSESDPVLARVLARLNGR